ncbi:hypothetical protein [Prolixibacter bellariivorans]|nr:hypothetical protein [Prolixibacter bellariivorans]
MLQTTSRLGVTVLLLLFLFMGAAPVSGQNLRLKVEGTPQQGYGVALYDGNQKLLKDAGAFSLHLSNLDLTSDTTFNEWRGASWTGNDSVVVLQKETYMKALDSKLTAKVTYQIVNPHIVKKTVELLQPSMLSMYYILRENNVPAQQPKKYVTFEQDNFPGGFIHELFPSAGFVTADNTTVGFLTDAGYKNQFTRTTRRRFSGRGGGFVGMRKLPDPRLFSTATPEERAQGKDYVRLTFGEMFNLNAGTETVLPLPQKFMPEGKLSVSRKDSLITMNCQSGAKAGIRLMTPISGQKVYTISFKVKGNLPVALKLYRVKNGQQGPELEHGVKYIDAFPSKPDEWTEFKGSILVPYIEGDSVSMFIGNTSGKAGKMQIKNLAIAENHAAIQPYNILPLGKKETKTTYIFVEPWKSHRDFMIDSQSRLAEGKGFKGSLIEKMLYANANMLNWITSVNDFTPFSVPNMNYSPDMYNRDSFWTTVATHNKKLNLAIWNQWAKTQTPEGAIGTIITPYMGSVEAKDNEATIEWLVWALVNQRRYGVQLPKEKIDKAVSFVLNSFDENHDGICESHFSMSQIDVCDYVPKTDRLAVNQGMFAVALHTIKALGYDISDDYLNKAESAYRKFYDPKRKHLLFDRQYPDLISLTDLVPEFLSLWLFNQPMLTDEMVVNQLNHMPYLNKVPNSPHPEMGTTAPILVRLTNDAKGYSYMTSDYQPFGEFGKTNYADHSRDGFYYNGGSWMRAEYCAYVVGLKHGWPKAKEMMENRAWAEINLNPKWPFSKEFIPTHWKSTDEWWLSTRGLSWNVFILMADEVAGLRTPDMDPDYK